MLQNISTIHLRAPEETFTAIILQEKIFNDIFIGDVQK